MILYSVEHTQAGANLALAPIIILHGMFGAGDNWLTIAREFGQSRPVWTIDLPGHGRSHDSAHSSGNPFYLAYGEMAKSLHQTLVDITSKAGQGNGGFWLCGHSMGGKLAMVLALQHPELVRGLIVVDSAPIDYRQRGYNDEVLAMLAQLNPGDYSARSAVDVAMQTWISDSLLRGFLLKNLQADGKGCFTWRFDAAGICAAAADIADWPVEMSEYPAYPGPALFLAGEFSGYIDPVQDSSQIRNLFPHAEIQTVSQARHWVHVDNKAAFMVQSRAFLLKMDSTGET